MIKWILIAFFLLKFCSSSEEQIKTNLPQEETQNQNPFARNKYELKLVAPLLQTPEIKNMVEKRKKDFAWRYNIEESEYSKLSNLTNSPSNRRTLINNIENSQNKYSFGLLSLYRLVQLDIDKDEYRNAAESIEKYKKFFPNHKEDLEKLSALLKEKPQDVKLVDMGNQVNSNPSYLPIPELNEKKIYYTSYIKNEEIVETSLINGMWTNVKLITELNTSSHDSPTAISADGTKMVIFGNYSSSFGNGDLFLSELKETGWASPLHLGYPINSENFESDGFFTPDGKAFLFVSDRAGGYYEYVKKDSYKAGHIWGNTDIYVSFIQEDGSFGEPINLGPVINTPGAERQPFLHLDGKTLYFSSNGFNVNFGDLDVYKSVRLDDTWTNWSEPVNVGKEINTSGADWGFKLGASGEKGYISRSNKLYIIEPLPKKVRPDTVIAIEGKVVDEEGKPLEADLEWEDLNLSKPLGKLKSKPTNGEFFVSLPVGKVYAYFARKAGYLSQSKSIDLTKEKSFKIIRMEIKLTSIPYAAKTGQEIVLGNILFQGDKDTLDRRSFPELDRLIKILNDYPNLRIEIQGHTSTAVGRTEDFNLKLSQGRANAVANYLKSKGIDESRFETKGYGSSRPISPNTTEENRAKNRRVSFKILSD